MSWHFLQGREGVSWEGSSSDGAPDALLRLIPIADPYYSPDNATGISPYSLFGTMYALSTENLGADGSTLSAGGFPARTSVPRASGPESRERARVYGENTRALLAKFGLDLPLLRTLRTCGRAGWLASSETLPIWGTTQTGVCWGLATSAPRISATVFGLWPTPTTVGNEHSPSMRKWPAHRTMFATLTAHLYGNNREGANGRTGLVRESFERVIGGLSLTLREWMMGWPLGWTALEPLETGKFLAWRRSHGTF